MDGTAIHAWASLDRPEADQGGVVEPDWQRVHHQLVHLAALQAQSDYAQACWLLTALRRGVHEKLGFGSFAEYAERLFGYPHRDITERLRVARALEQLPATAAAMQKGELCYGAARELTRVATAETELEWLQAARDATVRQIEKMVSGRRPGDRPSDPPDERARRHRLRFEVSAETLATFREALSELSRQHGRGLSEDEALLAMARLVLGGPQDEGRASYQIALSVCERCGQGFQEGRGELVPVEPEVVEKACCDAQHIGRVDGTVEPASPAEPDTHVVFSEAASSSSRPRARQSIPPAVRRLVFRRFGGQCAVPGCTHSDFLDLHHVRYRPDGTTDPDDLVLICGVHHDGAHVGTLIIEGDYATGLRFLHADGRPYGAAARPPVDTHEKPTWVSSELMETAEDALRKLGFPASQVRRVLQTMQPPDTHVGDEPKLQDVIRQALGLLTA